MHSLLKFITNRNQHTEVSLNTIYYLQKHDLWNHHIVFMDVFTFLLRKINLEERNSDQFLPRYEKNHLANYVHLPFRYKLPLPFTRDLIFKLLYFSFNKIAAFSFVSLHFDFIGFQVLLSSLTQILLNIFVLVSFFIILLLIKSCDLTISIFNLLRPYLVLYLFFLSELGLDLFYLRFLQIFPYVALRTDDWWFLLFKVYFFNLFAINLLLKLLILQNIHHLFIHNHFKRFLPPGLEHWSN